MQTARHQEIARAFGRRLDEHRRLDLDELALVEKIAHRFHNPVAQHQIALQRAAPQIEVAVLHAQVLVDVVVFVHLERRDGRTVQHFQIVDRDLDFAGG